MGQRAGTVVIGLLGISLGLLIGDGITVPSLVVKVIVLLLISAAIVVAAFSRARGITRSSGPRQSREGG